MGGNAHMWFVFKSGAAMFPRRIFGALFPARVENSLAAHARGPDRLLGLALFTAAGLLVGGWLIPIMSVRRLFFFEDRVSVLQALEALLARGQYLLFSVLLIFSILFPLAKILISYRLWRSPDAHSDKFERRLGRAEMLGRWSMLDVFLMAIAIAAVNFSLIADVHLHPGLYALAGGVVLSMLASMRMSALAAKIRRAA